MTKPVLIGWDEVAELTPWSADYVRKRWGEEMLDQGVIFKHYGRYRGRAKSFIWGYPDKIQKFFENKHLESHHNGNKPT